MNSDRPGISAPGAESVLFVDDDEAIVDLAVMMLESLGYQAHGFNSPFKALALFESDPDRFGLVITDLSMPGMDGSALAKKVLEIRPDMPLVLCTGYNDAMDHELKEIGDAGMLTKPFKRENLKEVVDSRLAKKQDRRPA